MTRVENRHMRHQILKSGLIYTVALRKHDSYNYITTCINIVLEVVTEILLRIVIMHRFEDDAVELGFAPGQIHLR
jgi:hypothetical protein